jgi:hypothetical protein
MPALFGSEAPIVGDIGFYTRGIITMLIMMIIIVI